LVSDPAYVTGSDHNYSTSYYDYSIGSNNPYRAAAAQIILSYSPGGANVHHLLHGSLSLHRLRNDLYCVEWGVKLYSNPILVSSKGMPIGSFVFAGLTQAI